MTTYPKLSAQDVKAWDNDYDNLQKQLATETDDKKKAELTAAMQSLAVKVEERLTTDIQAVRRYSKTRHQNVLSYVNEAERELKLARANAAAFKKKPGKTGLPPMVQDSIRKIGDIEQAYQADGLDYGAAWFDYRANPVKKVPAKNQATFLAIQGQLVNDDKSLGVSLQKIVAAKHQTEALLAITDKAAMKAGIKAGTATQRPITDAQKAADDVADQMAALLKLLQDPADMSTRPSSVDSGKQTLEGVYDDQNFWKATNPMKTARSVWNNVEVTRKLMTTKAANMEKVLATKTKGFRAKELADPGVKLALDRANTSLKLAKKEIKDTDADYAAAKKAMDKLEVKAKKLKVK